MKFQKLWRRNISDGTRRFSRELHLRLGRVGPVRGLLHRFSSDEGREVGRQEKSASKPLRSGPESEKEGGQRGDCESDGGGD